MAHTAAPLSGMVGRPEVVLPVAHWRAHAQHSFVSRLPSAELPDRPTRVQVGVVITDQLRIRGQVFYPVESILKAWACARELCPDPELVTSSVERGQVEQ